MEHGLGRVDCVAEDGLGLTCDRLVVVGRAGREAGLRFQSDRDLGLVENVGEGRCCRGFGPVQVVHLLAEKG